MIKVRKLQRFSSPINRLVNENATELNSGSLSAMQIPTKKNRRKPNSGETSNISEYLNDAQQMALTQMESFGWYVAFIRRPLFRPSVVVLSNTDHSQFAVLQEDGTLDTEHDIQFRR